MDARTSLRVLLDEKAVGTLRLNRNEGCEFRLLESYKLAYPRPVLGQQFLDDLEKTHRSRARVPPWFSNLLPEGALRELVVKQTGVASTREFFLLQRLGDDLPGAVRIVADGDDSIEIDADTDNSVRLSEEKDDPWHFSLAGVQLKFSALRGGRALTIPVNGQGGDWIVKLPDGRYSNVPENEYATMQWAGAAGIDIPELASIDLNDITGLPTNIGVFNEGLALAIRRFDRPSADRRVHMEDFAQILGLYPEEKYKQYNYETLAKLIFALTGKTGLDQFVLRLVFIILSGNGDAHHKNWSLIYPDGVNAALSPAYDLLSTIQYMPDDKLALNLAGTKHWQDIGMASFRRLARKIGQEEDAMADVVRSALAAILDAWRMSCGDFGYDRRARELIDKHLQSLSLLREA